MNIGKRRIRKTYRLAVDACALAVEFGYFGYVPAAAANEHVRQNGRYIGVWRCGTIGRNRGNANLMSLPLLKVFLIVLTFGAVSVPGFGAAEVVLQAKRLYVQPVFGFVQEQAQLAVDVARAQVLRRGAEQNDFVIARVQVSLQSDGTLVDVAKVVRLIH